MANSDREREGSDIPFHTIHTLLGYLNLHKITIIRIDQSVQCINNSTIIISKPVTTVITNNFVSSNTIQILQSQIYSR